MGPQGLSVLRDLLSYVCLQVGSFLLAFYGVRGSLRGAVLLTGEAALMKPASPTMGDLTSLPLALNASSLI